MDKDNMGLIGVYILYMVVCLFGWVIDVNHSLGRTTLRIVGMLLPLAGWFIYRLVVKFKQEDDQWNKYHGTDIIPGDYNETKQ